MIDQHSRPIPDMRRTAWGPQERGLGEAGPRKAKVGSREEEGPSMSEKAEGDEGSEKREEGGAPAGDCEKRL